jgi:hypothetical protein
VTALQPSDSLERRAYCEAGHAVMAFLILKAGIADNLFLLPVSADTRPYFVAKFEQISIKHTCSNWGAITYSLASLTTTPMVLLAGYAAERIKYNINEDVTPHCSDLTARAWHLSACYFDEYDRDDSRTDCSERDRWATETLIERYNLVEKELRFHWASVEVLASALLSQEVLSRDSAFEIIENNLPEETKARVLVIANQTD